MFDKRAEQGNVTTIIMLAKATITYGLYLLTLSSCWALSKAAPRDGRAIKPFLAAMRVEVFLSFLWVRYISNHIRTFPAFTLHRDYIIQWPPSLSLFQPLMTQHLPMRAAFVSSMRRRLSLQRGLGWLLFRQVLSNDKNMNYLQNIPRHNKCLKLFYNLFLSRW